MIKDKEILRRIYSVIKPLTKPPKNATLRIKILNKNRHRTKQFVLLLFSEEQISTTFLQEPDFI